jgi:tripartite-type tricarboxylate transporter receptor subunit TctC
MKTHPATRRKFNPSIKSAITAVGVAVVLGWLADRAGAQEYPTKPVRVITPFGAGSGPDGVLRLVGEQLTRIWGRQVVIENRPGGNGFIAFEAAKKAPADGYTLVQMDDTHMSLQPHLFKKIPYDVGKDFDPVGTLFRTYFFVVVPSSSRWQNMKDLIEAAKAKPGDVTYGSWFIGSPGHLGAAMLEAATGTQMTHVPYKETSQLYTAVGNGDINWAFGSAASSGAMYRGNKVKYIAVAAPQRVEGFPDVPTVAEAGGPAGFEVKAWVALLAPRGTPAAVVEKINADLRKVLPEPEVRERFATFGFEPYASAPSDVKKEMEVDSRRYGEIVKSANISID